MKSIHKPSSLIHNLYFISKVVVAIMESGVATKKRPLRLLSGNKKTIIILNNR